MKTPLTRIDKSRSSSYSMSYTAQISCETSSGYQSLESSWELDDSYIKVSKFTDKDENSDLGDYGTYKEYEEIVQEQNLATNIKEVIENETTIGNIKITDYLTLRTAGDVMNLSKCEPYGLKGCKLIIIIDDNGENKSLGDIFPEKGMISTFEITLVLHVKKNPCRRIPFFNCKGNSLFVLEHYEIRKEKLYTSKNRKSPIIS